MIEVKDAVVDPVARSGQRRGGQVSGGGEDRGDRLSVCDQFGGAASGDPQNRLEKPRQGLIPGLGRDVLQSETPTYRIPDRGGTIVDKGVRGCGGR